MDKYVDGETGRVYRIVPQRLEDSCRNCAFYRDRKACERAPACDEPRVVFVEDENTSLKDTNPKDTIGAKKAKMSVVPSGVLYELGLAMLEGACKYGRHNYRAAGIRASVYYDATMGHLMDFWEGQDIDPDSGRLHLVKALASLAVWIDAIHQDKITDDRPPRSKVTKADFNQAAAEIIDRYADRNPRHYTIEDTK